MKISGKVIYLDIEGGAFGIIDDAGKKYLPINMPNQLKRNGMSVACRIRPADVETSVMWGEPVFIYAFETM